MYIYIFWSFSTSIENDPPAERDNETRRADNGGYLSTCRHYIAFSQRVIKGSKSARLFSFIQRKWPSPKRISKLEFIGQNSQRFEYVFLKIGERIYDVAPTRVNKLSNQQVTIQRASRLNIRRDKQNWLNRGDSSRRAKRVGGSGRQARAVSANLYHRLHLYLSI